MNLCETFVSTQKEPLKYLLTQDVFTGLYTAWLHFSFSNCSGDGSTPEAAVMMLKIRFHQLRRKL